MKLTIADHRAISGQVAAGIPTEQIAAEYGISVRDVLRIDRREREKTAVRRRVAEARRMMQPAVITPEDRQPIVIDAKYAIRPYTMRVPNRTALVGATILEKNECHLVSLPLLAIQEKAI